MHLCFDYVIMLSWIEKSVLYLDKNYEFMFWYMNLLLDLCWAVRFLHKSVMEAISFFCMNVKI